MAPVPLLPRESAFADFKCDRATSLGMNADPLCKTGILVVSGMDSYVGDEAPFMVDAMRDLRKDVNFDGSVKGLQAQSMDSSHVDLVSLLPRESEFADLKCDRASPLGMNGDLLRKIPKMCVRSDSLKIQWQSGVDTICFLCEMALVAR